MTFEERQLQTGDLATLWTLRKALGDDWFDSEGETISVPPHPALWIDVAVFSVHLAAARQPTGVSGATDLSALQTAVDLYRDDLLAGFTLRDSPAFDDWHFFASEDLRQQLAAALQQLVQGYCDRGDYATALPAARRWLALDPLHEPAHQRLMQLYAWSGQRTAALRQYQECVRLLQEELAAPPDAETTQLFQTIQANRLAAPPTPSPLAPPPTTPPAPVPSPVTTPPPAELRIVTVLCAGLTDLGETHTDALPTTTSRLTSLLQAFQPLLDRYGARLDQRLGDQFLAVFGVYQMHEDDAERAVRAANELQSLARQQGLALSIGLHSGAVLMPHTEQSAQSAQALVMGPVVNLATRLQTQGEAGDILVSKTVYHQSWGAFDFAPVVMTVRGSARPLTAYLLTGVRLHPAKTRGLVDRHTDLVGRSAELSHLQALVEQLRQGEGYLVTLVGEAGVGKSRLVAELKATVALVDETQSKIANRSTEAHERPKSKILCLEGRAQEFTLTASYWPFLDALRTYWGWQPQEGETARAARFAAALQKLVAQGVLTTAQATTITPLIGRLLGLGQAAPVERQLAAQEPAQLHQQTLLALRDLLVALAQSQPLLLILEDLHWADPLSLELIGVLLTELAHAALLLCCVYRPEQEHAITRLGALAMQRCPAQYTELPLRELTPRQSRTLVTNLLATAELPPMVQEFILHKAQGNPLFVEELVHALLEMGVLYRDDGHWRTQVDLTMLVLPDTLHNLILTRLERLPAALRQVVQCAAVIGPRFATALLTTLVAQGLPHPVDLPLLLPQLLTHAFLVPEQTSAPMTPPMTPQLILGRAYAFRHVLVQEAVYSSLLPAERRRLHGVVAQALEQNAPAQDAAQAVILAHHWERAEQPAKAIGYLQQTADRARVTYAHAEALACYQRVITLLLAQGDYEQAARTYMKLGLTQQNADDFDAARHAFAEGFVLWQKAAARVQPAPAAPTATLRIFYGEPQTLEPAWAGDEMSENVIHQLFSGLVDLTPELGLTPDLAQSWHILHGGRTYLFRLRTDVTWSDGVPLTAHDFVYAWRRVLDPANGWWSGQALYAIRGAKAWHTGADPDPAHVGITARDDYTLVVELENPTSYFLALLTMTMTLPVPRHLVEKVGQAWTQPGTLVGSGPFLVADWQPGQRMTLVSNPRYHGTRQGNVQEINLAFGATPATALQQYEADRLDVMPLVDLPIIERNLVRRRHVNEYLLAPRLATMMLRLDMSRPPFADLRLRRALAHALDRSQLAGGALQGYDFPAAGLLPAGLPAAAPDSGLPYDPVQARQLLAAAGYPGGADFPTINAWAWPGMAPVCTELSRQWQEQLGVTIVWQYHDWSAFTRLGSDGHYPDLFPLGLVVAYPDPDDLLRLQRGGAIPAWHCTAYDSLLATAGRTLDHQQRVELYRQADHLLCADAPIIPLLYERLHLLIKPWVRNFPTSAVKWSFWKDVVIDSAT
jgi:ABC-type oligopeptide transport system substrate-binding subunit/class 3 adenylate cyclase